jgi:hypothetical protein
MVVVGIVVVVVSKVVVVVIVVVVETVLVDELVVTVELVNVLVSSAVVVDATFDVDDVEKFSIVVPVLASCEIEIGISVVELISCLRQNQIKDFFICKCFAQRVIPCFDLFL